MRYVLFNPLATIKYTQEELKSRIGAIDPSKNISFLDVTKTDIHTFLLNIKDGDDVFLCGGDGTLNEVANGIGINQNVELTAYPIGSGNDFFINLTNLALLVFGTIFVIKGWNVTYIDLTTYFLYINFLIKPISRLTNSMEQIQQGFSGIEKFYNIMDEEIKIKNDYGIIKNNFEGDIEFKDVCFSYSHKKEKDVLTNFNLHIETGEKIALVGETGVGKTTISKLIPRFYDVDEGEILVDGINVKDYKHTHSILLITSVIQAISAFVPENNGTDPNRDANNDYTDWMETRVL